MMLPRARPCPDQLASAQGAAPIVRGFRDVGPPNGLWAQAANKDTSCHGSYAFEKREARA
eukprot:4916487-Prorocentrum_lima.AAC.1